MKKLWKIACQEDVYPGMWQRWYKNQCVAVGWAAKWGFKLEGPSDGGRGWSAARNALNEMEVGDYVVVALRGHRVGRIGEITGKAIGDDEWNPLVPPGPGLEDGEMGRRVLVRWDLTVGPDSQDLIVQLPAGNTFSNGELRPTVSRIYSVPIERLVEEMNDSSNWVSLLGKFRYEKACLITLQTTLIIWRIACFLIPIQKSESAYLRIEHVLTYCLSIDSINL